jgi:hypothetical protein
LLVLCVALTAAHQAKADQPPANDFAGQIISDSQTGRVGVGTTKPAATLDVYQGEIKLGSTGEPCNKGRAGTIRYTESKLQLCDGEGWRNVRLDKAE